MHTLIHSGTGHRGRFLIILTILSLLGNSATAQILGDANGDGTLNLADVAFIQAALDGGYAQTVPFALSDVAHPCDGNIDAADLALVERAARVGAFPSGGGGGGYR